MILASTVGAMLLVDDLLRLRGDHGLVTLRHMGVIRDRDQSYTRKCGSALTDPLNRCVGSK
jgi:hypothetical protein